MANFGISIQPQSQTVVPGQNTTFNVLGSTDYTPLTSIAFNYQWYVDGSLASGATLTSFFIDPSMSDNGKRFFATVTVLSGNTLPLVTFARQITSSTVTLTVQEEGYPFNLYALDSETGSERHARLRHLGYI